MKNAKSIRTLCLSEVAISVQTDAEFTTQFKNVCQAVTGQPLAPDSVFCIDRAKKLFRVKISNADSRTNILNTAKNLKDHSNFSSVFINRDLTYKQRQERRLRGSTVLDGSRPGNSSQSHQGSLRGPQTDTPAPFEAGGSNFH